MSETVLPESCDLLVIGSGAGGLAAAITAAHHGLRPVIVEKACWFGGSTAISGGAIWVPKNHLMEAAGMKDDLAAARTYLQIETGNRFNAETIDSFLENAPDAIRFFDEETELKMTHRPVAPDYHPEREGAALGGRVLDAREYDGRRLGKELARLRPPIPEFTILGGLQLGRMDLYHYPRMLRQASSFLWASKGVLGYLRDRLFHGRNTKIKLGAAVAARLAETAFSLRIPILTDHALTGLERDAQGRICAARVATAQGEQRISVWRGVVLAAGGYPQDKARRAQTHAHLKDGWAHHSMAPASATGGALAAAEAIGAKFVTTNSDAASWTPVSLIPQKDGTSRPFPHLFMDRAKPGIIAVGPDGQRFGNEALSYHDFVQNMVAMFRAKAAHSAWLICDHHALRRYGLGAVPCAPGRIGRFLKSGYLRRGRDAAALAREIGVDAAALQNTITAFNAGAAQGRDDVFGKGSTPYQTALGDPEHRPNPCLAPLEGMLYAVELVAGDIGTTMGLDIDANACVRDTEGKVIPGLYAVGNDANSIMAGAYPGAGITLGPALTFGWLAGRHAAGLSGQGGRE